MQQLNEFECVVKAFTYLAAHLPRDEILEPVMDEAFEQIISRAKNMMALAAGQSVDCFVGPDVDVNDIEAAIGRSSSKDAAVGVTLCDAEPDMFPCLVVICGSAFAFLKVWQIRIFIFYQIYNYSLFVKNIT